MRGLTLTGGLLCVGLWLPTACSGDGFEAGSGGTEQDGGGAGGAAGADGGGNGGSGATGGGGSAGDCSGDQTACSGTCVDTTSDPKHCGECDKACPVPEHATATCTNEVCGSACNAPWTDCDGSESTGCETNTAEDADHCGACNTPCDAPPSGAKGQICSNSVCGCGTGLAQCVVNGKPACVQSQIDPQLCGANCTKCVDGQGCKDGKCSTPQCAYGQTLCPGDNACHNLKADWANCGTCGKQCDFAEDCKDGICQPKDICGSYQQCPDICTLLTFDPSNCGTCGTKCAAGEACMGGGCNKPPFANEPWTCPQGTVACNVPDSWPNKPAPYYCWPNCVLGGNPVPPG